MGRPPPPEPARAHPARPGRSLLTFKPPPDQGDLTVIRSAAEIDPVEAVACRIQRRGPEAVIFIHGLGASSDSFDPAFDSKKLSGYTLASLDLPGFGRSPAVDGFSCTMEDMARLVIRWLDRLDADRVHLVGHSMGGVIGIRVAEMLGPRAATFVNVEGNLGPEDCLFSGRIASLSEQDFERHGMAAFRRMLDLLLEKEPGPGLERYAADLARVHPVALHQSASALVRESREGRLRERFLALPGRKIYVTGERSVNPAHIDFMDEHGIESHVIPGSGHFMMDDRPDLFWPVLCRTLEAGGT